MPYFAHKINAILSEDFKKVKKNGDNKMVFNRNRIFQAAYSIVRKNSANPTLNKPEIACVFGFSQ